MEYDELTCACALNSIFAFSCRKAKAVYDHLHSFSGLFRLPKKELQELFGTGSPFPERICDPSRLREAEKEIEWCFRNRIRILCISDREYPPKLKECCDAPLVLYFFGNRLPLHGRTVSIVGTRKATSYGIAQCREIVRHLARLSPPPAIVSGLAYGIDVTAHTAAMEQGLDTYAVMATGLDRIYPPVHRRQAEEITRHGGLVTEFQRTVRPSRIHFLQRNRIIAGISDAVLLIESGTKGGGMVSAHLAAGYGREVFALPGRITDRTSAGCNRLIERNYAHLIGTPESISEQLDWKIEDKTINKRIFAEYLDVSDAIKRNILLALSVESFLDRETLLAKAGCDPQKALVNLTELEMDGIIETDIYGNYSIKND